MRSSVRNQRPVGALLFSVLALLISGCGSTDSPSTVQLNFPNWKAMRQVDLQRQSAVSSLAQDPSADPGNVSLVAVNVTGPGISQPKLFMWERNDDAAATPPASVSIPDVPKGGERLVQVLAVYEGTGSMQFYYADSLVNVASDSTPVDVTLTNVANASGQIEGNVEGRFMTTANQGPTGPFHYRFSPPGGKPSMVVHHGEIFNGWASLFSLSTGLLTYSKIDGTPLFPADLIVHNGSAALFVASNPERVVSARIPAGYRERSENGVQTYLPSGARRVVAGFFGAGVQGAKRVCYTGTSTDSLAYYYADAAHAVPVKWNGSSRTPTTQEAYVETIAGVGQGGSNAAACSQAGVEWEDYLTFYHRKIGGDGALAMQGPFKAVNIQATYADFVKISQGTNKATVSWGYLPGARAVLGGVGVFYRFNASSNTSGTSDSDIRVSDGFRCNELTKLAKPFTEVKVTNSDTSLDINGITATQFSSLQVVICPIDPNALAEKPYFASGISGYGNSGGNVAPVIAAKIAVMGPKEDVTQTSFSAHNYVCEPIWILPTTAAGAPASFPLGASLTFSVITGAAQSLHWSETCLDTAITLGQPIPITIGGSSKTLVYRRIEATGSVSSELQISAGALGTQSITTGATDQSSSADKLRWMTLPSSINANTCYPVILGAWNSALGTIAKDMSSPGPAISFNMSSPIKFYGDSICRSQLSNGGFSSDTTTKAMFVKYDGTATDGTLLDISSAVSGVTDFGTGTIEAKQVTLHQPGPAAQLTIMAPLEMRAEDCTMVTIAVVDAQFRMTPVQSSDLTNAGSALKLTIAGANTGDYKFYQSTSCAGNEMESPIINVGSASMSFGMRRLLIGANDLIATPTNATSLTARSISINVTQPALANRIVYVMPGLTYSPDPNGNVTGSANAVYLMQPFQLTAYAITQMGNIATNFNQANVPISTSSSGLSLAGTLASFTGGHTTVQAKFTSVPSSSPTVYLTFDIPLQMMNSISTQLLYDLPATTMKMYSASAALFANACQPFLLTFEDGNSYSRMLNSVLPLLMASNESSSSNYQFSLAADCSNSSGSVVLNVNPGNRAALVYYKSVASSESAQLSANDNNGLMADDTTNVTLSSGSASSATYLKILAAPTIKQGDCIPLAVLTTDGSGHTATPSGNQTLTLSTTQSGGGFYNDASCLTMDANPVLSVSDRARLVYFKAGTTTGTFAIDVTGNALSHAPINISVIP